MTTHMFYYPDMQTRDSLLEEARHLAQEGTDYVWVHFHAYDDREIPEHCSRTDMHMFLAPLGARSSSQRAPQRVL